VRGILELAVTLLMDQPVGGRFMALTPQRELRRWILAVLLDEPGGGARRAGVLEVIWQRFGPRLTVDDRHAPQTRPFEENWQNRASYERAAMVREGLLASRNDGVWELSPSGMDAAAAVRALAAVDAVGTTPEVLDAEVLADEAAGRVTRRGVIMTAAERTAIETHAVGVVSTYFSGLGYRVDDVGGYESYDLDVRRPGERIYVEVKGTTTEGATVVLTKNEVELHRAHYPNNALAVVHDILLDRSVNPPAASGGRLELVQPWKIESDTLTPLSYQYETGLGSQRSRRSRPALADSGGPRRPVDGP
jgi:uncharacterized protein DUF3883